MEHRIEVGDTGSEGRVSVGREESKTGDRQRRSRSVVATTTIF